MILEKQDRRVYRSCRRSDCAERRYGALFGGGAKSPAAPPPPPPAATPAGLAQAATNVAARNLSNTEQLFGGTIQNTGGAQGQPATGGDVKRSLLG